MMGIPQQRNYLGELLFPRALKYHPRLARTITTLIAKQPISVILEILDTNDAGFAENIKRITNVSPPQISEVVSHPTRPILSIVEKFHQ
jgi:hypothetical protein